MNKIIKISLLMILSFFSVTGVSQATHACYTRGNNLEKSNTLFNSLNKYRNDHYIFSLTRNAHLDKLAAHKAYEYSLTRQWAHNINGKTWIEIFQECGLSYTKLGENLSRKNENASQVIEFWANTPVHKANALDLRHRNVGLFVGGADLDYYTVAVFMN
jgi:uncharacterized protein YkwD